jgi:CYTH domain-containing protein
VENILMAIEIERKFLVKGSFHHLSVKNVRIKQAYLSVDPGKTIRLRISGEKAFLTIKSESQNELLSRREWEFEIPLNDALEIMKICQPGIIDKTRYYIPAGKLMFEVDVFHNKNEGLIIAEIELSSENEVFEKPEWLGEEVTGNPAYYNVNLIKT